MNDQTHDLATFVEYVPPSWFQELESGLAVRSQFIVSGNVRDVYPVHGASEIEFAPFDSAVWYVLQSKGCAALLIHDPVDGLRLHPDCDPSLEEELRARGIVLGTIARTPEETAALAKQVMAESRIPMALMLDYASTVIRQRGDEVDRLFVAIDKVARAPAPVRPESCANCPPRNPVIWVVDRPGDLPGWFVARNPALRDMVIGLPDLSDRSIFIDYMSDALHDYGEMHPEQRRARIEQFAVRCEGMTLMEMYGVIDLARFEKMGLRGVEEALRSYRIGTTRNPWTSPIMRARVRSAAALLEGRVKGQPRAVEKTYDILVRSIMGLSGAQTTNRGSRPRGILFFVGPTGVGKTELAKGVAEVMFGDETSMQRFDMSEFMDENSISRLIGPPPGAPGHGNGGELVNAVRSRPFGVFLFDEIEKAHPRVLDMFLQILDDGRLTDSRGETGYFSEALIIFTSNVGMVGGDRSNNSGQNILPSDSADALEEKLTSAVSNHFRYELKRPELMNRLGQNIVPFQFINPRSSAVIFDSVIQRVLNAVHEEHGIELQMTDSAYQKLEGICTFELNDGGRGIGNRIESNLLNPLSHVLFKPELPERLTITDIDADEGESRLVVE